VADRSRWESALLPETILKRSDLLRQLAWRMEEIESSQRPHGRASIPLGITAFDHFLPENGLPAGSLVELLSAADGAGAWTLGFLLAKNAAGEHKALVIVDTAKCFYPPAAAKLGTDLQRAIVIRPTSQRDAYAAASLSLGCAAVGAVLFRCDHLSALDFRRLQLVAEAGGGMGVLLRGSQALRTPSSAALRLLVSPVPSANLFPQLRVDVVRCRRGIDGRALFLEIDRETGAVRVPSEVASPATATRASRASG
jgi:protein ImuA